MSTSVDKKRLNEIVICPGCKKSMNNNTFTYTHNCQQIKQTISSIEATEKQITDEDVHDYLLKQETVIRDNVLQQKQERFNSLLDIHTYIHIYI